MAILAVLVWRVGTGPFLDGLRMVDAPALVAAARDRRADHGVLRLAVEPGRARASACGCRCGTAVAAYYRSQFLNTTLPGGVLGDVHRAVRHGLDIGDVGLRRAGGGAGTGRRAGRCRSSLAVAVLLRVPVAGTAPHAGGRWRSPCAVGLARRRSAALAVAARPARPAGRGRCARAGADVRAGLLAPRTWPGIVLASAVVVAGHLATFLLAARTAGSTAPLALLVPLTLLALLAMALPLQHRRLGTARGRGGVGVRARPG